MTTAATAQDLDSANYALRGCKAFLAGTNGFASGRCVGIVEAIAMMAQAASRSQITRYVAIPTEVTAEQAIRVVVTYIEERPSRMHESFKLLALEAVLNAWPCRN
jgi:hypothetical protein